ncbi:hypothetical protein MHU86_10596 [Fragilaria crotonensis]|nr:hypothetical protein MHU86_10596 [Fragilaria crotonensis]
MAAGDQPIAEKDDEDRILSGWAPRKSDMGRFTSARNGDNLMVPFECDFCVFGKLFDHEPSLSNEKDVFAMACIRRVILDAFWSRARSTVDANTAKVREGLCLSREMGMRGPAEAPGPLPKTDHCGYEVAIQIVVASLGSGRYSETHKQWDTVRRFRSAYSNQVRAARDANSNPIVLTDAEGKSYQRIGRDACGSLWFARFTLGCRKRMGQDWRPNQAISIGLVHELLRKTEERAKRERDLNGRQKWVLAGGYFCICFVLSLRSPEGLMADLEGLIRYNVEAEGGEVVIALLGRFKGEHHAKQHLLPSKGTTGSGIRVSLWVRRMMAVHRAARRTTGPVFVNQEGYQSSTAEMNELFLQVLAEIYDEQPALFSVEVKSASDLPDKFNVFRSFRRGSESRAVSMKVTEADRYIVNRWKKKEAAGANKTSHAIDQHYVDITLVKDAFMRYTDAM